VVLGVCLGSGVPGVFGGWGGLISSVGGPHHCGLNVGRFLICGMSVLWACCLRDCHVAGDCSALRQKFQVWV
jgi:hypothetical protein